MPGKCFQDVLNGLFTAYERAMHTSVFISVILKQTVFVPESRLYFLLRSCILYCFSAISRFTFLRCREIARSIQSSLKLKHCVDVCGVVNTVNRGKLRSSGNNSLFSEEKREVK